MKISEEFRIFNQTDGEFKAKIVEINRNNLKIILTEKLREAISEPTLILAICIIKQDRFIEAIKSAIQLGVTEIIPIISTRTQFKNINEQKITKCIIESAQQSETMIPPTLHKPKSLKELILSNSAEQIIFANENESPTKTIRFIQKFKENIIALVGPEGGFSDEEINLLAQNSKICSISLGSRVLRSETATCSILSSINLMRN